MPRMPRIHIEGGLYYATARGDHGGELFRDDTDREKYLELLANYKQQYEFKLFSFILMPTYIYLLIEPASGTTISQIMHDINSTYTKYFNGRYKKKGHLFQERFRAILVEKGVYLKELTRYIHLTPLRTHLTERVQEYPWSSYPSYINKLQATSYRRGAKIDTEEVLGSFSSEEEESRRLYGEFVNSAPENEMEMLEKKLHRGRLLGSNGFVEKVKAEVTKYKAELTKYKSEVASRRPYVKVVALASAVILFFSVAGYLLRANIGLKKSVEEVGILKEAEFDKQLSRERRKVKEKIRRDLEEKYQAEMVSYRAMAKRLEMERKKVEELKGESNGI